MHGIVHSELKRYVTERQGADAWSHLLDAAGVAPKPYLAHRTYPDEEVTAVVDAAALAWGQPVGEILEQFGQFIAPTLMSVYEPFIRAEWRTLDLIEHTERTIHTVVRMRDRGAAPPFLRPRRIGPTEVHIEYTSPRRLCMVGEGICRGVARHFGEQVDVSQTECMHRGAEKCVIVVRLAAG